MNTTRIGSGLVSLAVIATLVGCSGDHPALEKKNRAFVYTITEKPTAYLEADRLGIWFPASDFEPHFGPLSTSADDSQHQYPRAGPL
jgi:hypothetical protein